jgi:long-chain fatty acid transport protein
MRNIDLWALVAAVGVALAAPSEACATDRHFLHGVGAVNASMGGAGAAGACDILGVMYVNPAGLMAFQGSRVDLGFELFQADRTVASDARPFGSGSTQSKKSYVPMPAFGWSYMLENGKVVLALGGLGIGGFGVGQMYSNFQLMKIAPSTGSPLRRSSGSVRRSTWTGPRWR